MSSSLARRLVLTQVVVLAALGLTVLMTAALLGPGIFAQHMHQAGHGNQPHVLEHAEQAFRSAGLTSLAVGLGVAIIGALAASVLLARRMSASLAELATAARRVSRGDHARPVRLDRSDRELRQVGEAFNAMSERIEQTETTRRRMLTDLSHEMRTPLAAIGVTVEALQDEMVGQAEAIQTITRQAERLTRLADDIARVSAVEEGQVSLDLQDIRIEDLVRATLSAFAPAAEAKGVALETDCPPGLGATVDPVRLGQVLDNLVRNALQHTPAGGHVRVATARDGDALVLRVEDDGDGISPDHLPHVFERFYRADGSRRHADDGGTGVGLSIARALTRAHGGSLEAASEGPGSGTRMMLRLPVRP
ncbi:signal transduction histidine kinase [Luteococcus japonicus]|uniref:histidine kinase n=1 Tax=Luteococcus japonicus TaxID=33984 RepID=A0A3N1ZWW1_9ACTN|nr:HAMP domain-containing sensor histidine kinase [Luteococcus japonicus]ROR55306.1 signal transduction histidine kinase [Luteococcus japonicus]